ncbi:MORN repeat-containing protein [Roseateles oligotrophus]|uniref:MORN repeat protein n=1 Tax=Roseateles oligotrophus TaxID=1769250 RepID=A0ABT2YJT1_9BURK|nr:hypothetical protein [Roseateles oligotrophus]MCV2370303.1 hypothetical protein [Roseateles oligotrophus]
MTKIHLGSPTKLSPWRRLIAALALSPCLAWAQTPALLTPPTPASAPAPALAADSPASAPAAASAPESTEATAAVAPPTCSVLTQRAMSADLRAATALSQNKGVDEAAKLFDRAIAQWTLALDGCEGRARERAQKNLSDNERQRGLLAERQAAGSQCELSHRDAASLQELAARAFGERRWVDAASLYSKAETMWDLAAEHCTGAQQQIANKRREQAEIDAHNSEHCAPLFERAREYTQKFRGAAAGLNPTDRQQQSQTSETLWRKAAGACKGAALELAGNNAQAVARERGTPWVATHPVEMAPSPAIAAAPTVNKANAKPAAVAPSAAPTPALGAAAAVGAAGTGAAAGVAASPAPAPAKPAGPAPSPANPQELDVRTGDTRYKGLFTRDEGQTLSGTGRVEWGNGDIYIGTLLRSVRQGKGEFIWANGQRYSGDWLNDKASGSGKLLFTNGNQFEGTVIDGTPEGEGQLLYASGDAYKGQISQGIPHGRGSYRWLNGQQFDGDWVRAVPQGKGVLRFANGNRYEGAVVAGQPQGQGQMQMSSGERYEGNFHQGEPQGQGSYFWKSGERYVGAWVAGRKHGQGIFHWPNGDRWEGEFKDDERTQVGVFTRKE